LTQTDSAVGVVGGKWLKKATETVVDLRLFHENMLQRLKLCFQLNTKYLAVKRLSSWVSFFRNFGKML